MVNWDETECRELKITAIERKKKKAIPLTGCGGL
jgi:hypothetical protein